MKPILSRPKDESLEAFKAWITEMTKALGGKTGTMTEKEWVKGWKEFWKKNGEQS